MISDFYPIAFHPVPSLFRTPLQSRFSICKSSRNHNFHDVKAFPLYLHCGNLFACQSAMKTSRTLCVSFIRFSFYFFSLLGPENFLISNWKKFSFSPLNDTIIVAACLHRKSLRAGNEKFFDLEMQTYK